MIKLADILNEVLGEANIVRVPQEIIDQLDDVYDYVKKNEDKLKEVAPEDFSAPFIPSKYNKYLKFNDLKGEPIEVSIGLYNDPKDAGAGRMDTKNDVMLINLAFLGDKESFLDLGEHELVHAMDPKVRDVKIFGKIYPKKGAEPDQDINKYYKSPWEFDAFTAPLINKLKKNADKAGPDSVKLLYQMLSDLKTKDVEAVKSDSKYDSMPWLFSSKEWADENWPAVYREFAAELNKIKTWTTKPTLYKQFLQRVYKVIQ